MNDVVRSMLELAIDSTVKFGVLCFIAELATRPLQRAAPGIAHRMWVLVACAGVVLPVFTWFTPAKILVEPSVALWPALPAGVGERLASIWVVLWAAGTGVAVVRLLAGLWSIRQLVRCGNRLSASEASDLAHLGGMSSPRASGCAFLETSQLSVPVTVGHVRPCVLLPDCWRTWPRSRLAAVVAHEGAHVDRADYLLGLGIAVLCAIWWWHPGVWLAAVRLRLTAELACDRHAARGRSPVDYAEHLLALAAGADRRLRYGWIVGATSRLSARVDALLSECGRERTVRPHVRVAAVVATIVIMCSLASIRFTALIRADGTAAPRITEGPAFDHSGLHAARHASHGSR